MFDLEKAKALEQKATPGPWDVGTQPSDAGGEYITGHILAEQVTVNERNLKGSRTVSVCSPDNMNVGDAEFVAQVRTLFPEAIQEIEWLREHIVSGFYEEEYPIYTQGLPEMELQSVVTADELNGLVARISILSRKTDLNEFLDVFKELAQLMDDVVSGDYEPDTFTTQPAWKQLGLFGVSKQENDDANGDS